MQLDQALAAYNRQALPAERIALGGIGVAVGDVESTAGISACHVAGEEVGCNCCVGIGYGHEGGCTTVGDGVMATLPYVAVSAGISSKPIEV